MVIFLHGPDSYRRLARKRELVADFESRHDRLGLHSFDLAEEKGLEALMAFMRTPSLFSSEQFAILDNAFAAEPAPIASALKEAVASARATVLLSEEKLPSSGFGFLLRKPVLSEKFEYLKGHAWHSFISAEAERRGFVLAKDAIEFFARVCESDTWRLATEFDKIALLGEAMLGRHDLGALEIEMKPDFWGFINGLGAPDLRRRLESFERLWASGEAAAKVFNLAAYARRERLGAIANYDRAVKSGKLDYEEALLDLVL